MKEKEYLNGIPYLKRDNEYPNKLTQTAPLTLGEEVVGWLRAYRSIRPDLFTPNTIQEMELNGMTYDQVSSLLLKQSLSQELSRSSTASVGNKENTRGEHRNSSIANSTNKREAISATEEDELRKVLAVLRCIVHELSAPVEHS